MTDNFVPYADLLRKHLQADLVPSDDGVSRVGIYLHRMLTVMKLRKTLLPELHNKALTELSGLLDELNAELGKIDGSMILIPQLVGFIRSQPDYPVLQPFLQSAVRMLAENSSEKGYRLLQKIASITFEIESGIRRAAIEQDIKPVVAGETKAPLSANQKSALVDYLRKSFGEPKVEIGRIKAIIGGGSKRTLIVELRHTTTLPSSIVLRIDMADGVVNSTVTDEYRLIKTVFDAGVKAPQPFAVETDASVLGAPFILVSRIEGHNIGDWIEVTEPTRAFATGLARTLVILHNIPPDAAGSHLPGAKTPVRERIAQELMTYETSFRASGEANIAMEQALAWLKSHLDFSDGRRAIVHCDLGCHNMLGHNGEFAALLDWETAMIDNPARDLAYVPHTVTQMMPWEDFLAEYKNAGGRLPSERELDFYRVLCGVFRMHYELMARSFFLSGASDSLILGYAAQHLHQFCDFQLHEAVKHVLETY